MNLIIPPWVKWLGALLVVTVIIGAIYAYGQQQYGLGEKSERAAWLKRENQALSAANAKITELQDAARATERRHAEALVAVSNQYQEDLKNVASRKDRVIADLRAGNQRLRIPVTAAACAGAGGVPEAGPGASGRNGEARAELSDQAAEFLVGLASEADGVAEQLKACQALVRADRNQSDQKE